MTETRRTVYLITGPAGVGKSTVSRALAQTMKNSAHINADLLYHMIVGGHVRPWEDNGHYLNLLWDNIACLLENFITRGIDVVVDYIIFPEHLKKIREVARNYRMQYVILLADEEELIARDKQRPPDEIMGKRVLELLEEFKNKNISETFIVNTTKLTVEETVQYIVLNNERFRVFRET